MLDLTETVKSVTTLIVGIVAGGTFIRLAVKKWFTDRQEFEVKCSEEIGRIENEKKKEREEIRLELERYKERYDIQIAELKESGIQARESLRVYLGNELNRTQTLLFELAKDTGSLLERTSVIQKDFDKYEDVNSSKFDRLTEKIQSVELKVARNSNP